MVIRQPSANSRAMPVLYDIIYKKKNVKASEKSTVKNSVPVNRCVECLLY